MNNKNIKHLLLESIVSSDFLSLDNAPKKQLRHIKSRSVHKKSFVTFLDLFETLKSLKQLIRSLSFLSAKDQKILHVWLENKQYLRLLDSMFNDNDKSLNIDLSVKNSLVRNPLNLKKEQLLFLLDFPLKNNKKNIKRIFNEKIYLINKVNLKLEKNNWGSYKIYNDLKNFKKFLFLFILVDLIFDKNK